MKRAVRRLRGCKREDDVRDRSTAKFSVLIHGSTSDYSAARPLYSRTPLSAALETSFFYIGVSAVRPLDPALGRQKAALD